MKSKIIGIMAAKNLISQGYPFLEAIYSFLNWGDELYISDGYSNDATFDLLKRLVRNKKIHVYKYEWPKVKRGKAIGYAYNNLVEYTRKRIRKEDYIFELQANEVAHEGVYEKLRNLPEEYPKTKIFILPYNSFCWKFILGYDWRFRLAKTSNKIKISGDGMHMEITKEVTYKDILRDIAGQLYRYAKNGQYYSRYFNLSVNRGKRKHPSLYKPYPIFPPIFRYSLLFPANIPFKFKGHSELYKTKQYTKDKCSFENVSMYFNKNYNNSNTEELYSNFIKEYFDSIFVSHENSDYTDIIKRTQLEKLKHPKVMKGILDLYKYKIREDLIDEIIKL